MSNRMRARNWSQRKVAFAFAWLSLLLVASGFSRLLVVCTGPHPEPSVEFVHATGQCGCGHDATDSGAREQHPADRDLVFATDTGGCVDVPLRSVPWTRLESDGKTGPDHDAPKASCPPCPVAVETPAAETGGIRAPPPRAGGRLRLLRSVVLLI
jgi:hypothetical protein